MLCKNNEDMTKEYFSFLLRIINSPLVDKFTDLVIRKFIYILQHTICENAFPEEAYMPFIEDILDAFQNILCLRSNNDFLAIMVNTTKSTLPIWLYATDYFLALLGFLLQNLTNHRSKALHYNGSTEETPINQEKILGKILETYDKVLRTGEKSLGNLLLNTLIARRLIS